MLPSQSLQVTGFSAGHYIPAGECSKSAEPENSYVPERAEIKHVILGQGLFK